MCCIKSIIFVVVSALSIIKYTNSLEESLIDSVILETEEVIRLTTNKLFAILHLRKGNPILNRYLLINQHFASLTIQDHDHLNKISKIARANGNYNASVIFMTAINELFNDGNQKIEEYGINNDEVMENDNNVVDIINTFLNSLKKAKEIHDVSAYVNINDEVLSIIEEALITSSEERQEVYSLVNETESGEIQFWKPSGRRIYRGERTKIKYFPFMASIQIFDSFHCGGSIIKSDLVITASSCLQLAWNNRFYRENPAFLSVQVGSSFYNGGGEVIPVLEVYFHPGYNPKNLRNNICIVRLTRKIKFKKRTRRRVQKIEIDKGAYKLPNNFPAITIVGWGAKGRSNLIHDPWQNVLSYAVLDIYQLYDCQDVYSKEYVTEKNFCAGFISKGGGACNRDIGDPGISNGKLMGIVSFGSPRCGEADAPTVFTKLGYYANWIQEIMEQNVPYSHKLTTLKPPKTHYPTTKQTTLKTTMPPIYPIAAKDFTPIPIKNVLRIFDEDLFKEFMKTMFYNTDNENQNVFDQTKRDKDHQTSENERQFEESSDSHELATPYTQNADPRTTKLIEFKIEESEEMNTQPDYSKRFTIMNYNIKSRSNIKNSIEDLINDIDMIRLTKKNKVPVYKVPVNKEPKLQTKGIIKVYTKGITSPKVYTKGIRVPTFFKDKDTKKKLLTKVDTKKNESILTVLYLSEEKQSTVDDTLGGGETNEGLSIAIGSLEDLTRSKGKNEDLYEVLPEQELYEILSEVIDDEMRNNKTLY